jgi:ParB family chromosome partitioning protein
MALGRGLGAILEEVEEAYAGNNSHGSKDSVKELDLDTIIVNPFQPRKIFDSEAIVELSESIKKHGLLQPVLVIKNGDGYMLIAGERRLRAVRLSGSKTIKAIIADLDKTKIRELALIENIQRENLNPIELAHSLKELIEEYGITHEELSDIVKKSRSYVTNSLRLLNLSDFTQEQISSGKISYGHAKVLVGLAETEQKKIVNTIVGQKLSVRETEELVSKLKSALQKNEKPKLQDINRLDLTKLTEVISKKSSVAIKYSKNSVTLKFETQNEVDSFVKSMK